MKRTVLLLIAVATVAFVLVSTAPAFRRAEEAAAPTFVTTIPSGYRDWRLVSVAHEEGNLNSLGAILGNDVAINAYREGKLPFPDGTIIAALHFRHLQSFVPGQATNVQFMVKDSTKYAATGGWGFGHFTPDGKTGDDALMKTCFPCHAQTKQSDLVFTQYAQQKQ